MSSLQPQHAASALVPNENDMISWPANTTVYVKQRHPLGGKEMFDSLAESGLATASLNDGISAASGTELPSDWSSHDEKQRRQCVRDEIKDKFGGRWLRAIKSQEVPSESYCFESLPKLKVNTHILEALRNRKTTGKRPAESMYTPKERQALTAENAAKKASIEARRKAGDELLRHQNELKVQEFLALPVSSQSDFYLWSDYRTQHFLAQYLDEDQKRVVNEAAKAKREVMEAAKAKCEVMEAAKAVCAMENKQA